MTSHEFRERLARRAIQADVSLPPAALDQLGAYFTLLSKWNAKINLTALPLETPTDETWDRLFIEPLIAARQLPHEADDWFDLGSGGGSPAIPLKIVRPSLRLAMVEAKIRKAAFLRETVRVLELPAARVENARFEEVADQWPLAARFITVRAVRIERKLVQAASKLLKPEGSLILFQTDTRLLGLPGFSRLETVRLAASRPSFLTVYRRLFHVEQSPGEQRMKEQSD